jgi:hypothetical protein
MSEQEIGSAARCLLERTRRGLWMTSSAADCLRDGYLQRSIYETTPAVSQPLTITSRGFGQSWLDPN